MPTDAEYEAAMKRVYGKKKKKIKKKPKPTKPKRGGLRDAIKKRHEYMSDL